MSADTIRRAVDLVEAEPSDHFVVSLRARLLDQAVNANLLVALEPDVLSTEAEADVIVEERVMPDIRRPRHRMVWIAAAAALVAVVGAGLAISLRDDTTDDGTLKDVDSREALPLANSALMTAEIVGEGWSELDAYPVNVLAQINAETRTALPQCAELTTVGLMQPTTKSVLAHHDFVNEMAPMLHDVWVFATPEDASRAMDVIAGGVFPSCLFDLFDRTTARGTRVVATSRSQLWDVPNASDLASHGDRQVIIGQKIDYTIYISGGVMHVDPEAINAFVQVGRAIGFVDPQYFSDVGPGSHVEKTIAAMTVELERVFGSTSG
jgi:hypothetical protein